MDFIPGTDGARIGWLTNLINEIDTIKEVMGLSDAFVAEIKANASSAIDKYNNVINTLAKYQSAIGARDEMEKSGEMKAIRASSAQIKTNDAYTTSIGNTLLIVTPASPTVDPNTYKAQMTVSIQGDLVRLKFTKAGADSVNIYKRKKGSNEWLFLARDTSSPYDDHITLATPGQPEHWEYRAYGVLKDQQIGTPSDILQIIYGG